MPSCLIPFLFAPALLAAAEEAPTTWPLTEQLEIRYETHVNVTPADLAACTEPSVSELLDELRQRIGEIQRSAPPKQTPPVVSDTPSGPRHWWERYTGRVSVVVRW